MCGTVGLFTGCPAAATCLRLGPAPDPAQDENGVADGYRSPFRSWDERASVRAQPRRVLAPDERGLFFSPELVPGATHPLVRQLDERRYGSLLVQHLYRYLDFTAKLEHLVVNRTVLRIAHGCTGVALPEEMRLDAYKIYCDEAYHALFSADLIVQVRNATGVQPRLPGEPFFLVRLREILGSLSARGRDLAELLFVIVSETLISATLADIPEDEDVSATVRGVLGDHAADEARHHAYFATFLRYLWAGLDPAGRREAGLLVPRLIDCFLRPDVVAVRDGLLDSGLAPDDADQVVDEVFAADVVETMRATSRLTVRHFRRLGALEDPRVELAFAEHNLI